MAERSAIEWCDSTFNPWIGCTKVSPACDHCYAEAMMDTRMGRAKWGAGQQRVRTSAANWRKPLQWNARPFAQCPRCGWRGEHPKALNTNGGHIGWSGICPSCLVWDLKPTRRRVFCASLADVFDNEVPVQWRRDLFDLISATPSLDWLLLTKRIGNAKALYGEAYLDSARPWPANVWLGATICNQAELHRDIPKLRAVPARVRFLSIEPMLSAVDMALGWYNDTARWDSTGRELPLRRIDWVIAGGESGPHARPSHPDWFRSLRDQCADHGVPFLFKQWGEHLPEYDRDRDDPDWRHCGEWDRKPGRWINLAGGHGFHGDRVCYAHRVGKKAAGRKLDGVEHNGFPA